MTEIKIRKNAKLIMEGELVGDIFTVQTTSPECGRKDHIKVIFMDITGMEVKSSLLVHPEQIHELETGIIG